MYCLRVAAAAAFALALALALAAAIAAPVAAEEQDGLLEAVMSPKQAVAVVRHTHASDMTVDFLVTGSMLAGGRWVEPEHRDHVPFVGLNMLLTPFLTVRPGNILDDLDDFDLDPLDALDDAALDDAPRRALVVGLGAGCVPSRAREFLGWTVDVLEHDPVIVDVAVRWFDYVRSSDKGATFVSSLTRFLRSSKARPVYDLVVIDVFSGPIDTAPYAVETLEAIRTTLLVPGGVLAINIVCAPHGEGAILPAAVGATLAAAGLPDLRIAVENPESPTSNVLLMARDTAAGSPWQFDVPDTESPLLAERYTLPSDHAADLDPWPSPPIISTQLAQPGQDADDAAALAAALTNVAASLRHDAREFVGPATWAALTSLQ